VKLFIFRDIGDLTDNYHDGGSAVVIAADIESAISLLPVASQREASNDYVDGRVREFTLASIHDPKQPEAFIFPDAGCC
jgi:hypothetical protein